MAETLAANFAQTSVALTALKAELARQDERINHLVASIRLLINATGNAVEDISNSLAYPTDSQIKREDIEADVSYIRRSISPLET
jgi:hypothetical protein